MRIQLLILCLTVAVHMGTAGVCSSADLRAGYEAYRSGDYEHALREWKPLAEQGDASAQTGLGLLYENGFGVPKDVETAILWHTRAANQGLAGAQYNLALIFYEGKDIRRNYKEALKWFRLAAEQGFPKAQANLGAMYAFGMGIEKDYVYAHMWGNLAAAQGHKQGAKLRDDLAKLISPSQLQKAMKLAGQCAQNSYKGCVKPWWKFW